FFIAELENVFDDAWIPLELLAERDDFPHDDRRTGKRLQNRQLSAFNSLCDFDFTIAGQQRDSPHLTEIHTNGIVRFFECSRRKVQFDAVFRLLAIKFLFAWHLVKRSKALVIRVDDLNAGGSKSGKQIVEILSGCTDFRRQKIADFVVKEVSFLL